jgi:tetratricopeptide (TPR) repeat protein
MDKQFQELGDLVTRHFNDGHLDQLERELCDRTQGDAKDLRASFKLGVLAAARYQLSDAARNFSVIAASGWKTGLARHNLATVYFRSGLTRIAIEMLLEEAKSQETNAATFFNLGIICDQVAALGDHIPPELVECGLLAAGRNVRQDATQYFERSLDIGAWSSGLDGALYLWPEDVPPNLGFPVNLAQPSIENASRHLYDGIACLDRHEWRAALEHLDLAAVADTTIRKAAADARKTALIGLCREIRTDIARAMDQKNYTAARDRIGDLALLCAEVPIDDLIEELLLEELNAIAAQLRQSDAAADFSILQTFSKAIGDAVDRKRCGEAAIDAGQMGHAVDDPTAAFARRCAGVVEDLLRRMVRSGMYEFGADLLAWSEQQWFAPSLQTNWRREINHARSLSCWTFAKTALAQGDAAEAESQLAKALLAARDAEAAGLARIIELELSRLRQRKTGTEGAQHIQQAMAEERYADAARLCSDAISVNPHDDAVTAQLAIALERLRGDAHAFARAAKWTEAAASIDSFLEYKPDDVESQLFRARAAAELNNSQIEQGWNRWQSRPYASSDLRETLTQFCAKVLALDPQHARALELLREMEVVDQRVIAEAADSSANQQYRHELVELDQALIRNDATLAFASACRLRALRPLERHTRDACDKAFAAYVGAMQTRLELDVDVTVLDEIEGELGRLLNVEPDFRSARDLLGRVQRRRILENSSRRAAAQQQLDEADQKLTELEPVLALQALEPVFVLDLPECKTRAQMLRELATGMAKRQVLMAFAAGQEHVADALGSHKAALSRWSPAAWQQVLAHIRSHQQQAQSSSALLDEINSVIDQARDTAGSALSALFGLDRNVRRLRRRHGEIPASELAKLQILNREILETMPLWSRAAYRLLSRMNGTVSLYSGASTA